MQQLELKRRNLKRRERPLSEIQGLKSLDRPEIASPMPFGQLVIGPPGSGKTTYCHGVSQFLTALGRRVAIVNLDPANDLLPYKPDVDVAELVCLETVMQELQLGPNGGMVYCMEYLAANLDWLKEKLQPLADANVYVLLDCPGQVELFTQHNALKEVVEALAGAWHWRLAAVHLVDAHLCTDAAKYISALLLSLSTMLHLELPQVNVLSKVDLVKQYGDLAFNLDYYTEVQDLSHLVACLGPGPFSARFRQLAAGLCEVVEGYGLLAFTPLAVQERASVERLVGLVDKANGAVYAALDKPPVPVPAELLAAAGHRAADDDIWSSMQEKYIDGRSQQACQESSSVGEQQQQQLSSSQPPPLVAQHVRERQPMDEG